MNPSKAQQIFTILAASQQVPPRDPSAKATAGFVLGLVSFLLGPLGFPAAVVGFALSCFGLKSSRRGLARAGLIASTLYLAIALIWVVVFIVVVGQ